MSTYPKKVSKGTKMNSILGLMVFFAFSSVLVVACGPTEIPFREKSYDEKLNIMGVKVFPELKKMFEEFDSKKYANFSCKTCHGEGHDKYKMPGKIVALDPNNIPKNDDKDARLAKYSKFMREKVQPKVAELLGMKAGPDGIGCFTCHAKK